MAQDRRVCGSVSRLRGAAAKEPSSNGGCSTGREHARRQTRRSGRGRTERSWRSGQAKRGRRATARNGGANRLIPTAVLQKTHKAVWLLFKAGIRLDQFFSK